jgi:hypothetical protein
VKIARKQIYKKCLVVLICLLLFGNLAHRSVLCSGPDECVSIELRSTDCSDKCLCVPFQPASNPCGQCIDIPIYTGLEKTNRVTKQLNSSCQASATNVTVLADKFNLSAYNSASSAFDAVSYFTPLRAVILLI